MNPVTAQEIETLTLPAAASHKGQNGRLLIIGGSQLFHAASLWALTVASRIVDLVHYSSVDENNALVHELKSEFRNGIVIARKDIENYIQEDDVILIGPGMMRSETSHELSAISYQLPDILKIEDEGVQTYLLTKYLLEKYPQKQWVIDAGALQMLELSNIPKNAILTPHHQEFELLFQKFQNSNDKFQANSKTPASPAGRQISNEGNEIQKKVEEFAKIFNCIVLLKGPKDIASNGEETVVIEGGNAGMTKGGTGDVLAGLIAALACKNNPWLATRAGSFINKRAGDDLYSRVGPFFNATDLAEQIPMTMKKLVVDVK